MRCAFYCTAAAYKIDELVKFLSLQGAEPKIFDQVIHIENTENKSLSRHIFYFSYGCAVFWGFTESEENLLLEALMEFEIEPLPTRFVDTSRFLRIDESTEEKTYINEEDDEIVLVSDDPLIKLSLSFGLSQSVKLTAFEKSVDQTIETTRSLPEELKIKGQTSLSKKELAQLTGALFAQRNSINLHSDILDTPEFFWRRPRYDTYYEMAVQYLDISTRLDILNRRLSVLHELYEILSNQLNHLHSARLELTIIYLIVFEVVIALLRDVLHWI